MNVTIDKNSGYCFGVEYAIQMAEDELQSSAELYCLGDCKVLLRDAAGMVSDLDP